MSPRANPTITAGRRPGTPARRVGGTCGTRPSDVEAHDLATRIQARAVRRCGELLDEVDGRGGDQSKNTGGGVFGRLDAGAEAGLSPRQVTTAVRVAHVPADEFELAVESDAPPTVTALAARGTEKPHKKIGELTPRADPRVEELNGQDPIAFIVSTNINRRHLTKGQRAMAIARIYPEAERGGRGNKKVSTNEPFRVAAGAVSMARTVLAWLPQAADAVLAAQWINARTGEPYSQVHVLYTARTYRDKFTYQPRPRFRVAYNGIANPESSGGGVRCPGCGEDRLIELVDGVWFCSVCAYAWRAADDGA